MENNLVSIIGNAISTGDILKFLGITYFFPVIAYLLIFFKLSKVIDKNTEAVNELKILILNKKE